MMPRKIENLSSSSIAYLADTKFMASFVSAAHVAYYNNGYQVSFLRTLIITRNFDAYFVRILDSVRNLA